MPYKYVEGLTLADVAFRAEGSSLEEVFKSAGLATTNVMVKDLNVVRKKISRKVRIEKDSIEKLLFEFIDEIIFYKDKDMLIFSGFDIRIREGKEYVLDAVMTGEKIDARKHEMLVDVKAVTWHKFFLEKKGKKWIAQVILDI